MMIVSVMSARATCPISLDECIIDTCRSGQILNLFWEKTDEEAFYTALMKAAEKLSIEIIEYTTTESSYLDDLAGTPDSGESQIIDNWGLFSTTCCEKYQSSALLALCEGNPPMTDGFHLQGPVMRAMS